MKKKQTKYRIVEHKRINHCTGKYVDPYWTVEKEVHGVFKTYWKTMFTSSDPWYDRSCFNSLKEAQIALDIYTGKLEKEKVKIVGEYQR